MIPREEKKGKFNSPTFPSPDRLSLLDIPLSLPWENEDFRRHVRGGQDGLFPAAKYSRAELLEHPVDVLG